MTDLNKSKISVLLAELERRQVLNARYSMRAFARDLGISHTLLSLIVSGKRALSEELARKIMASSKLPKNERDIMALGLSPAVQQQRAKLSLEMFAMMADWVHYAILSLSESEDFKWEPAWIAQRLGITETKAKTAMARLLKLKMVEQGAGGRYRQSSAPVVIENTNSTAATRTFNEQLMKKAIHSMHNDPFEQRDLSSIVFMLDPKFVPYAVDRIRNFRRSLSQELENLGAKKNAYALTVQLFPLSKGEEKK